MENYNGKEKISFLKKLKYSTYDVKNSYNMLIEKKDNHKKYMAIIMLILSIIMGVVQYNTDIKNSGLSVFKRENILEKLENTESGFSYDNDSKKQIDIVENKTSVVIDTRQIEFDRILEEYKKSLAAEDSKIDKITMLTKENLVILLKDEVINSIKDSNADPEGGVMIYNLDTKESRDALLILLNTSENSVFMFLVLTISSLILLYIIYLIIFKTIGRHTVSIFAESTKYDITKEEIEKIATYSATTPNILFALAIILFRKFTSSNLVVILIVLIIIYSIYVTLMMRQLKQKGN